MIRRPIIMRNRNRESVRGNEMKLLILATLAFGRFALAQADAPQAIETYGDSVTAGFMSFTQVTNPPSFTVLSGLWSNLATFVANGDKTALRRMHAPELSWAEVLGKKLGVEDVRNYAVSRTRVKDLITQVAGGKSAGNKTIAAFFFMGHNDLCHYNTTVEEFDEQFRREYTAAIAAWDAKHEGDTLYLIPPGDVARVYQLLDGYTWLKTPSLSLTCNQSWDSVFPFCRENAKRMREGTVTDHLVTRTKNMRTAMAEFTKEWNRKSATRDRAGSEPNHFVFLDDILQDTYEKEFFAVDCYHLSAYGQSALADGIFKSIQSHH